MKSEKYFVGLDIGTDSVGYAVTDTQHNLCKFKGEPMWGVTLFDEAQLAAERRSFRTARRRLDRRQQRIRLIMELFAEEIAKSDENFFKRIKESYRYPENDEDKIRLFDTYEAQKEYTNKYPTIHHLITELMSNPEPHDARIVFLACAWLVAHRGHFLNEVDKRNIEAVTDFNSVYQNLVSHITRDGYSLPWKESIPTEKISEVLKAKQAPTKKSKALASVLFEGDKAPKDINHEYEYNYASVISLICGGKVSLKDLFGNDDYDELEEKKIALNMDDDTLAKIMQSIGDDAQLILVLKAVYDWSILVDSINGKSTISQAKVEIYEQHQKDLKILKKLIKKYIPEKYNDVFRSSAVANNYAHYVGKNKVAGKTIKCKKASKENFYTYIKSVTKSITPDILDAQDYANMLERIDADKFMPKQVDGDNRVIPYQLYWHELNTILENAKEYIPFLKEADADGITGAQKVLSVFEFRIPYYVGPLKEESRKYNHWMVRKAEGAIYPWNFNEMVDLDASEEAFIRRMTNTCTYVPGEDVLPKNSLVYSSFEVLNEINNIKINGNEIPVSVKQSIYNNVFMQYDKVTLKRIKDHLLSNGFMRPDDILSGLDISIKSSLKPFRAFRNLIGSKALSETEVEKIITRATYSEDKSRFKNWLKKEFPKLPESEIEYISSLKFKEFGRLSRKLLCGIEGAINKDTGEYMTIIRTMWETNYNLMELLSDKFEFSEKIQSLAKEYYDNNHKSLSERLDEMWISNSVKRPIIRTLDIMKDITKAKKGQAPDMIFIEMARGSKENEKGKRTSSRLDQIRALYEKIDTKDVRKLSEILDNWGDSAHNKLQSDKLFLYFLQLGRCLYTDAPIGLESLIAGDGTYNIEHIYPRSFVKDDSIINNKILVDSKINDKKSDNYPIDPAIQANMYDIWMRHNKLGLLSDEKFKRLTRKTTFTDDEKFEFINRQLVETRQSTKAVATLLKELYPDATIVYVKAGLVSDFRQEFKLPKSRAVNDLHHAKDAYLNIVTGDVWHHKFSRKYFMKNADNNAKIEAVFSHPVKAGDRIVWNGESDIAKVKQIASKNTAHITMYSFCKHSGQNGGLFDQQPVSAEKDLIPLKKDRATEIYGGYKYATIAGFILVKYKAGKKAQLSLVPLKLLNMANFISNDDYAFQYVANELEGKASEIEILLNKRILKIYATLSLDGARYCIRGKAGLSDVGLINMMPFMTSPENEKYIKKLERITEKHKKNNNFVWDEKYDGVNANRNIELYNLYIQKLSLWPYNTRPGNETFLNKLRLHADDFKKLEVLKQAHVLLQIQGVLGRIKQADLSDLMESSHSGTIRLSLNLSNWKKNYTDVRIIDQSASGLYEKASENLLELL